MGKHQHGMFFGLRFLSGNTGYQSVRFGSSVVQRSNYSPENGKKIEIKAPQNSQENIYVQSLKVNNLPYSKTG